MFDFLKKKESLEQSGLLSGMIDWHSHILPGVDDGVKTLDESLEILAEYERLGIKEVWLTPHIMEDIPNTTAELTDRFRQLQNAYSGSIKLNLAAEYMIDALFPERLEMGDLLPLGTERRHLLVETSYYSAPATMDATLRSIMSLGYFPVLAHPERYQYMQRTDYERYLKMGVIFQSNLFSLLGRYGNTAAKKAAMLLDMEKPRDAQIYTLPAGVTGSPSEDKGAISFMGSDLHSLRQLRNNFPTPFLTSRHKATLNRALSSEK